MFNSLYKWSLKAGNSSKALWILALVSFSESAILPISVDAVSIPLMITAPKKIWKIALIGTVTSIAGGILGYIIGYYLYDTIGNEIINLYSLESQFIQFQNKFKDFGWLIILFAAISPFPFKIACIACGFSKFPILMFFIVSSIGRLIRFYFIATAFNFFGSYIRKFIEINPNRAAWIFIVIFIGGFFILYYY